MPVASRSRAKAAVEPDAADEMPISAAAHLQLTATQVQLSSITAQLAEMKADQKKTADIVNALNDSWNQATGVVRFVKWMSVTAGTVAAIIVAIKAFFLTGSHGT